MHNHNNRGKGMMWMMIPCLLLIVIILLGGGKFISSKYLWLVMLGVCVVPHIWMMLRGQGGHGDTNTEDKAEDDSVKQTETKNEDDKHKDGSCCH